MKAICVKYCLLSNQIIFEGIYRILFREAGKFVAKYNKLPNAESFKIELDQSDKLSDEQYNLAMDIVPQLFAGDKVDDLSLIHI